MGDDALSKASLERLLKTLLALGQEKPAVLLSLTQVVQPLLQDEYRVPLLARMFQDAPRLLAALDEQQLRDVLAKPPADAVVLKLLLDLRGLVAVLRALSYLQLTQLSKALAGQSAANALRVMEALQGALQALGFDALRAHHALLAQTPVHLERAALLRAEPLLSADTVPHLTALLRLPYEELEALKLWLEAQSQAQLILLVNVLQLDLAELLDLRRRLTPPVDAPSHKRTRDQLEADSTAHQFQQLRVSGERARKVQRVDDPLRASSTGAQRDVLLGGFDDMDVDALDEGLEPLGLDVNMDMGLDLRLGGDGALQWDDAVHFDDGDGFDASSALPTSSVLDAPLTLSQFVAPPMAEVKDEPAPPMASAGYPLSLSSSALPSPLLSGAMPTFHLRIQKQPPAQTVYQRIVKPFPAIALVTSGATAQQLAQYNLFVEATVIRGDSEKELPLCLDGSRVIRIQVGALATYRKLKILATTAQQGCLFRIRFQLKRYEGNQFYTVPGAVCISNPVEVFSHTYYLTNRKKNAPPPPPTVTEALPARLAANAAQRCVVLGNGFIDSAQLRVRIGQSVVKPVFHESKTLIVAVSAMERGTYAVAVANDGKDFCQSAVTLTFE